MAISDGGSSEAEGLPAKEESETTVVSTATRIPRRKLTLVTITALLNILLWSSVICVGTAVFQIVSDPNDSTNIPSEILTLASALATISYTFLHTVVSLKQRVWTLQGRATAIKRTVYVATRIVIVLCCLWLLTSGWNMIIVARQPVCLSARAGLGAWQVGATCGIDRLGIASAAIALVSSCALFGMLCAVSRPFEAHLYKHGYHQASDIQHAPSISGRPSPTQNKSCATEEQPLRHTPAPTHRRTHSGVTIKTIDTLDLSASPPPASLYAPSPMRSLGLGVFTSDDAPPVIPAAYASPPNASSFEPPPPIFHPSVSHQTWTRPPRLSGSFASPGFVPSIAPRYSASTWRAVHPGSPPNTLPASRSHPNLQDSIYSHRNRYSRSSVSLTKPHRLSTMTPTESVTWSSKSGSAGPEGTDGRTSDEDNTDRQASDNEMASPILNGTSILGTMQPKDRGKTHKRTVSAPDAMPGTQQYQQRDRMALGWKPQLVSWDASREDSVAPGLQSVHFKIPRKPVRSASADFLGRVSHDSSPYQKEVVSREKPQINCDQRPIIMRKMPARRSRSVEQIGSLDVSTVARDTGEEVSQDSRQPITRILHSDPESRKRRVMYDKPLPKIAAL